MIHCDLSSFLCVAGATTITAHYNRMKAYKEQYERWYNEEVLGVRKLEACNANLRGVTTRMKNKEKRVDPPTD